MSSFSFGQYYLTAIGILFTDYSKTVQTAKQWSDCMEVILVCIGCKDIKAVARGLGLSSWQVCKQMFLDHSSCEKSCNWSLSQCSISIRGREIQIWLTCQFSEHLNFNASVGSFCRIKCKISTILPYAWWDNMNNWFC